MQRFRFRLERVLHWQGRVCRLEEDKFRRCAADVAETDEKIARLTAQRVAIEREFASQTALVPADFYALAEYRKKSAAERGALGRERQARVTALDAQRQKLIAARRTLQIIEKLRERALQEYTRAVDREVETLSQESYLSNWVARR